MKARLIRGTNGAPDQLMVRCPGCIELGGSGNIAVPVNTADGTGWTWNGSLDAPTLSPSLLTKRAEGVCHSFLTDGVFAYLGDCTHSLAGCNTAAPEWDAPAEVAS